MGSDWVRSGEFHVIQAYGPRQDECIEAAISAALMTGSVGATYSIEGHVPEDSGAKVERVAHSPVYASAHVNLQKG